ncbi:MAG TPA: glycerate kinase [Candidatus Dormibacteraeota bacterium]|nr:glycerate kinase [Candidatus Dormibacteraeota bacterium]
MARAARPLRVVVAPDSFKGSLTSVEVALALAAGWRAARPDDELLLAPLADGGEGTLVAIAAAGGWDWRTTKATDPIGRPVAARWLRSADGRRAVVELAEASGLSRLAEAERDPIGATTRGTGEVIDAVLDEGITSITLGIGGSATTDGGAGLLRALGASIGPAHVDLGGLDPRLAAVDLRIACDVSNPLLGPRGAAATYGPQKGATPGDVATLDASLAAYADRMAAATGRDERGTPGAGAAGGTAFGLLSVAAHFRSVRLVPGVEVVMSETGLHDKLDGADLVITGEGRIDSQTAYGKTALGVARLAGTAGVACIAVGGGVDAAGEAILWELGAIAVGVSEAPIGLEAAMAAGSGPVERCGRRLARLFAMAEPR